MTTPSRPSRFGNLRALKERGDVPPIEESSPAPTETPALPPQLPQEATKEAPAGKVRASTPRPQKGDKAAVVVGKSKRPDYHQTTIYVRASVHADAADKLRREQMAAKQRGEDRRDLSDVIDGLLEGWAAGRFKV